MNIEKNNQMTKECLLPGIYAAALTPLNDDLSCNCMALMEHCNDLINRGCKGIILFGTTGEGSSFSVAEREQVVIELIRLGIEPQKIVIGISCCAVEDSIRLALLAINQRCAAVLIAPPFFYKNVSEEGIIQFYKKIIQSINHPNLKILLYHIPQFSGVPITINIIKSLKDEFPNNIIGIKESEGNLNLTKEILLNFKKLKVFVGNELHISEAVQLGGWGGISGAANAYPELICSLYDYGKNPEKTDNNQIAKHNSQLLKKFNIFPAIKALVEAQKGVAWHIMRPPLVPLSKEQREELLKLIKY